MPSAQPTHHLNLVQHIFGTSRSAEITNLTVLVMVAVAVTAFILVPIIRLMLDALDFRRLRSRELVFLEITPPSLSSKTPQATAELDAALHGLLNMSSFTEHLLHRKQILSLELVSTREGGIRYIVPMSPDKVELFKQLVISYLPSVRLREVEDYLSAFSGDQETRIAEFKQAGHFAYPLAAKDILSQHDPIAYVTGALARPLPGELVAFQLVLSAAPRRTAGKVRGKLIHGQDAGMHRKWWHYPFIILGKLIKLAFAILTGILELIGDEVSGVRGTRQSQGYAPPAVKPYTKHVLPSVHDKLDQPLFNVDIRALVIGQDSDKRMRGLVNSLYQFHVPGYQGLVTRRAFPNRRMFEYWLHSYRERLPAMFTANSSVLAPSEIASLYHFPYQEVAPAENLVRSLSKDLPTPLAMKQHADANNFSITVGINRYHGSETPIGLTAADREKHIYVIGGTGNGKTTMLEFAMVQDFAAGRGVAFIDPHGDAAQKLVKYIPESRIKDVIYLNPRDIKYPIGINLLELPEGLDEDEMLIEQERVTEAVVSILRKVFADDDSNAHRIEAMLRNAIRTAFTIPDATLFTILKLLRNAEYRNSVVANLDDEDLKDFWREEFGQAGGMQRVSMSKGLTHRIDRFRASAPAYRMFNQVKSTISFEDILDSGKILICNFSTDMGEDTSTLFGTTVLAKLKIAAERRANISENERRPFYVYVDEFQNFATTPFVKMLSASRKYKVYLTIAEQSTAQQEEERLTEAILANVSTVVCFRTGSPADERLLLPWFTPYIEQGEISNLPSYHYYMRVRATESMDPVSGETVLLADDGSEETADRVVQASRERYATTYLPERKAPALNAAKLEKTTDVLRAQDKSSTARRAVGRRGRRIKKSG